MIDTTDLGARASRVAKQHRENMAAYQARDEETAGLMRDVLALVAPAFGAIATRSALDLTAELVWRRNEHGEDELVHLGRAAVKGHEAMSAYIAACKATDAVIERLSDLLDRQLAGNARKRTAEATSRAERLRAVRLLLAQ